jgi:hypothetical protein
MPSSKRSGHGIDSAEKQGIFQQSLLGRKFVSIGIHYLML